MKCRLEAVNQPLRPIVGDLYFEGKDSDRQRRCWNLTRRRGLKTRDMLSCNLQRVRVVTTGVNMVSVKLAHAIYETVFNL